MQKDERELDILLSHALKQQAEPDEMLQRKVLSKWKEREEMRNNKRWTAAVAACACVLAVTVSVGAAGHYLSSRQVAEEFGMNNLAKTFTEGDGIEINQTQSWGDYDVTLMGVASGVNLGWAAEGTQPLDENKTYAVVAIERKDGTPMSKGLEDEDEPAEFFVSPLIKDFHPANFNMMTMNGGFSWTVIDGVRYQVVECDNVEIFADHGLYLCVMDRLFFNSDAYDFDAASGTISPKAGYEGMNLLFDLPLDAGRADKEKVEEYLSTFTLMFPDAGKQEAELN